MQGGDTPAVLAAGMPNILGQLNFSRRLGDSITSSGALSHSSYSTSTYALSWGQGMAGSKIYLDASASNKIFGSSTTVQPPALVLIPQIKY